MAGAASIAARPTAGVCRREWHRDTEDDARKDTRGELAFAQLEHGSHLLRVLRPSPPRGVTREDDAPTLRLRLATFNTRGCGAIPLRWPAGVGEGVLIGY
jgi:hypothetical protein